MTRNEVGIHIQDMKEAFRGTSVAESLGLRKRGSRYFCPLCQDDRSRTPDLSISDRGFNCFKCGEHGDLYRLVQVVLDIDFKAAVDWLASQSGQEAPQWSGKGAFSHHPVRRPQDRVRSSEPLPVVQPRAVDILRAFLDGCRPVDGPALDYLTGRGIVADVVTRFGLRFCGREYAELMKTLEGRFGPDALVEVGLMKISKRTGKPYSTFWPMFAKQVGFLVIPYRWRGRAVYLKARPPIGKNEAEKRDVPRFMNTGSRVPIPFNVDAIGEADSVLICEGESDTMTAASNGFDAVGIPGWSGFRPEWVELFDGKQVFLVMDADQAGDDGAKRIARMFDQEGRAVPRQVLLPPGLDLNAYFTEPPSDSAPEGEGAC